MMATVLSAIEGQDEFGSAAKSAVLTELGAKGYDVRVFDLADVPIANAGVEADAVIAEFLVECIDNLLRLTGTSRGVRSSRRWYRSAHTLPRPFAARLMARAVRMARPRKPERSAARSVASRMRWRWSRCTLQ